MAPTGALVGGYKILLMDSGLLPHLSLVVVADVKVSLNGHLIVEKRVSIAMDPNPLFNPYQKVSLSHLMVLIGINPLDQPMLKVPAGIYRPHENNPLVLQDFLLNRRKMVAIVLVTDVQESAILKMVQVVVAIKAINLVDW